jgi:hypothetical protein
VKSVIALPRSDPGSILRASCFGAQRLDDEVTPAVMVEGNRGGGGAAGIWEVQIARASTRVSLAILRCALTTREKFDETVVTAFQVKKPDDEDIVESSGAMTYDSECFAIESASIACRIETSWNTSLNTLYSPGSRSA